jgi:carbamoyl-phosphate synthase large subunit
MKDIIVLSTACGANFMPGFFTCLKCNHERNITIIGVDCSEDSSLNLLVDKYYTVPRYTDNHYVDILLDICIKENVDIFFPQISMELSIISRRIEDFRKNNIYVAISDSETLGIANSKYKLYEYMQGVGLAVPQYFLILSSDELRKRIGELGYPQKPVCVKVTESSGSRGVRIVHSDLSKSELFLYQKPSSLHIGLNEMCEIIEQCNPLPEMIAMEYLPGVEYTVDLLADHGKILYIAGRRNTTSSMSIAQSSVVEMKENAYQLCCDIVSSLQLDGNIGFDFMLDENDNPVLTDLNPRVTATIVLYAAAGLNLPYLRVKQLLNEQLPSIDIKYGTKLVRKYWDVLYNENGLLKI